MLSPFSALKVNSRSFSTVENRNFAAAFDKSIGRNSKCNEAPYLPDMEDYANHPSPPDFLNSPSAGDIVEGSFHLMKHLSLAVLFIASMPVFSLAQEPMKIIDTHVHLYSLDRPAGITWIKKDNKHLYRDVLPKFHEPIAADNGVSGVVLVQAGQSMPDNQWNLDISAHNPKLYRGVVGNLSEIIGTDAFATTFKELCKDPRYLGYRLSGRPKNEIDDAFYRDLKLTAAAGKSVDILLGSYTLKEAAVIASKVPELRIIIDHFGGVQLDGNPLTPEYVADFRAISKAPNVYCKVSALYGRVKQQPAPKELSFYKPVLDLAFECFGEDRLVYGSDWPVTETTGDYASVLKLTRAYFDAKGAGVSKKLFSENAARFYAIP